MKLKSLLTIATASLLLASCLKSRDTLGVHKDTGSVVSEIWDRAYYGDLKFISLDLTPSTETISDFLTLRVHAPRSNQPAGGNVRVTLVQDNAAVTAAGLTVLPSNAYTLPSSLEFTVPANGEIKVPITLNKNNMNLANSYGLGFKISSVSGGVISELAKSIVIGIGLKNRWDGRYMMSGTFVDFANSAFTYYGDQEYHLITTGPNQVRVFNADLGLHGYLFLNGSTPTYYGSYGLIVNFDPATNAITSITNYYGQPSANGRSANLDPSGVNKWDPATKNIQIKHWMDQPSVITPHRAAFNETWTYLGPR
jgi:hypothetical protein